MRILNAKNPFPRRVINALEAKQDMLKEEKRRGVEEALCDEGQIKTPVSVIKEILEQTKPKAN